MAQPPPPPPPPSPPPGPPPGPGASSGPAPFSIGDAIGYGWNAYWKNVGPLVVITLVIWLINVVFAFITFPIDSFVARFLIQIVGWVVGLILAMGLIRATLAVTRGETPDVQMLFQTERLPTYLVASIIFGVLAGIGFLLCIIPGVIVMTFFGFFGYVIVDAGEESPIEALRRSQQLVSGNFGTVLGLAIVLVLINMVGALLCGVGLLFTAGITAVTWAYAYRALSGQPVAPAGGA